MIGLGAQDSRMFHDKIRASLACTRPAALGRDLVEACQAAQFWNMICILPDGLVTVADDRDYRLSCVERQPLALARLLLKARSAVILEEATVRLSSGSTAAMRQALETRLAARADVAGDHAPAGDRLFSVSRRKCAP